LPALVELRLDTADITDSSIGTLSKMTGLRQLNLYHTLVTEQGFESVKKALPQCSITYDRDSAVPNRRKS
jgi:hypothetical protein